MHPTRQLGAVAVLVAALALLAVLTARLFVLGGAVLVGAWLLAQTAQFARDLERTMAVLSVEQSPARPSSQVSDAVPVTLVATLERPSPVSLSIDAGLPTGATSEEPLSVTLEPGETVAERTVDVSWPVVGTHRFDEATVVATDGRFRETLPVGRRPEITVESNNPRSVHVGTGGDRLPTAFGEHETSRSGSGIDPAELREYVPGDTAQQIDWKATARLGTPHVREFEAETDRRTLLVVDHRRPLSVGPPGQSKLEYLREVALATIDGARGADDPLGLLTVGDGGITGWHGLHSAAADHRTLRRWLFDLEPTAPVESADSAAERASRLAAGAVPADGEATEDGAGPADGAPPEDGVTSEDEGPLEDGGAAGSGTTRSRPSRPPGTGVSRRTTTADVTRHLVALEGDDDAFAETLGPFLEARQTYRERIESDPLYTAVRTAIAQQRGFVWTALFTDDSRPAELRETVKLARANGNEVAVFLAPTVLYEPGGLADVERAYDRYVAFERLRRDLSRMERVTALEVGPGDRLATVLEAGRSRGGRP